MASLGIPRQEANCCGDPTADYGEAVMATAGFRFYERVGLLYPAVVFFSSPGSFVLGKGHLVVKAASVAFPNEDSFGW